MKILNGSLGKLFLSLLALVSLGACGGNGPGDAVEEMMFAIERGEAAEALEFMPPSARVMYGDEKLTQMIRMAGAEVAGSGGIEKIDVVEERMDTDASATVVVKTTFGDGTSGTDTTSMQKIGDAWVLSDQEFDK